MSHNKGVTDMERIVERVVFPIAPQPKAKRVAAYARVSTGKDVMHHSLSAQVSYYSRIIQAHPGWLYAGVYSDEAFTGTKEARPGLQALLTECRAGMVDLVITKSISRLARNTVTVLEIVRDLKSRGIDVFFEEQNIHSISSEGELMLTILASYAQAESLSASENMKWRVKQAFERGEIYGLRRIYGYVVDGDQIIVQPDEALIVQEIFRRVVEGESLNSIASDLNRRGLPSSLGKTWRVGPLSLMISNEKYTGNALLQKHFRNNHLEKKKMRNRGERAMYYAEETHDAIIDPETFAAAQEIVQRNQRAAAQRGRRVLTPYSGLIYCGKCGTLYRRCKGHGIAFWNCSTYTAEGKDTCPGCRIHENTLIQLIDETADLQEIERITVRDYTLTFYLKDGRTVRKPWEPPSRAASWTAEMKEAAAEKTRIQRRRQKWQKQSQ